jgi:hypothetical protein
MLKFENDIDREREDHICDVIAKSWRCSWGSMGKFSPFDKYLMRDGRLCALVEIKARLNRNYDSFATIFLNFDKYVTLLTAELFLKMPTFFVIGFSTEIYYVRIGNLPIKELGIFVKGREDRQAFNDIRPTIEIPRQFFKKISALT